MMLLKEPGKLGPIARGGRQNCSRGIKWTFEAMRMAQNSHQTEVESRDPHEIL